jgi:hypothetical protein
MLSHRRRRATQPCAKRRPPLRGRGGGRGGKGGGGVLQERNQGTTLRFAPLLASLALRAITMGQYGHKPL